MTCGAAAIVPVPFVDDFLLRQLRRRWVRDALTAHGVQLDARGVDHLAGIRSPTGWQRIVRFVYNATLKLAFKLVKRVFRSIFFVLAVKDAADAASKAFHRGFLEHRSAARMAQHGPVAGEETLLATGWAIDRACEETDTRAAQRTLKTALEGSRSFLRSLRRRWGWSRRGRSAEELTQQTARDTSHTVVDEVAEELSRTTYLETLDERCAQLTEYWSQPYFHATAASPGPHSEQAEA